MPIALDKVTSVSLGGSLARGGWELTINSLEQLALLEPLSSVLIDVKDYLAGSWDNYRRLAKMHIREASQARDWRRGEGSYSLATSHTQLENWQIPCVASFYEVASGYNTHKRPVGTLTAAYVLRHMLTNHCNLTQFATLNVNIFGSYVYQEISVQADKFWTFVQTMAQIEFKLAYFDKYNCFQYTHHPFFISPLPDAVMDFNEDFITDLSVQYHPTSVSQVKMFGVTYNLSELASFYPASGPGPQGEQTTIESVRVDTQAALDSLAERYYRWANRIETVVLKTKLNHELDIGDVVSLTYTSPDESLSYSGTKFMVAELSYELDLEAVDWNTTLTLERLSS